MAKYVDYKKMEQQLLQRTEGYASNVRAIYEQYFTEIINLVKGTELEDGVPFSFSEYGYGEEVNSILRKMYSRVYQVIRGGVEKEWLTANENNDELVKAVFGESSIEDNHFARFFKRNKEAMDAFFARKNSDHGLNLSQKVWNYTGQFREELENTLDLAIGEGTGANRIATKVKQYLNEPDKWYRRFRYKKGEDADGNPVYGLKWKRRVWDKDSESYKWVDDEPKGYHPGRGVYRSSARNAQRLARTETNMAYRTADYERWQQLDFVVGIEIKLSNNHTTKDSKGNIVPLYDVCDDLAGIYPKTFKWRGWHPHCRCYQVPVLAKDDEMDEMLDAILDGKNPAAVPCEGKVREIPAQFTEWMERNEKRVEDARERGTLPYFIRDNEKVLNPPTAKEIAKMRHEARTQEQADAIKRSWWERKAVYHFGNNVLNIMGGIADVDTLALQEALRHPDLEAIKTEANKLKAIGKKIYSLSNIENPMEVAKKFSMADAVNVDKAVADKLDSWMHLSLEAQQKKLAFEAYDYLGGNMNHVQDKYPTWQVSQQAYIKKLKEVEDKIEWNTIGKEMSELESYSTKSSVYKAALLELQNAYWISDKDKAKVLIETLKKKRDELEKRALKRAESKVGGLTGKEIKDLLTNYNTNTLDEVDNLLRPTIERLWPTLTEEERTIVTKYTQTYAYLNEPLRNIYYCGGRSRSEYEHDLPILTDILSRCEAPKNMVVRRGTADYNISVLGKKLSEVEAGDVFVDGAFLSTAAHRTKGFFHYPYNMVIVIPKGSKGVFAEAFSHYTDESKFKFEKDSLGEKLLWNGKSKENIGLEFEWISQRGSEFKVIKRTGNTIYLQLISQLKDQK